MGQFDTSEVANKIMAGEFDHQIKRLLAESAGQAEAELYPDVDGTTSIEIDAPWFNNMQNHRHRLKKSRLWVASDGGAKLNKALRGQKGDVEIQFRGPQTTGKGRTRSSTARIVNDNGIYLEWESERFGVPLEFILFQESAKVRTAFAELVQITHAVSLPTPNSEAQNADASFAMALGGTMDGPGKHSLLDHPTFHVAFDPVRSELEISTDKQSIEEALVAMVEIDGGESIPLVLELSKTIENRLIGNVQVDIKNSASSKRRIFVAVRESTSSDAADLRSEMVSSWICSTNALCIPIIESSGRFRIACPPDAIPNLGKNLEFGIAIRIGSSNEVGGHE